ncbi:AraC family transcriptional regulator [Bacillus sp. AFS017336]|uniref:helix-turn-helix domain-containing protein n=1 Tax=Bacillus sp. AFS017336 TaxID=2033489 RepID=UPI000BF241AA|nr:AraC family transcriptional regulator [Bacillus sp. AFS017336]PEL13040.1 hypothetical protein CN601_06010 [Bacillus sp. AFS017336]
MKNYHHMNLSELEMKLKSFHIVSEIDILGIDLEFGILFSFVSSNRITTNMIELIKSNYYSILESQTNHFKLYWSESNLYDVFFIKKEGESLIIILSTPLNLDSSNGSAKTDNYKKQEHFLKLFQWLIRPFSNNAISQPKIYHHESNDHLTPYVPDVSLIELYYENDTRHATSEEYEEFKSIILEGKFTELDQKFDFNKLLHTFDQIDLAKGDSLRSMKNHFIAACGIISQYAIDSGSDHEYARTLADKYITLVEGLTSRLTIFKLMKEMIIKFSECIIYFSNPNYSNLIKKIILYLNTNFYESITLQEVARKFNTSTSHLSKKLKNETGMSFNDNLNKIRVNESKKLLLQTDKSILEVAIAVGFNYQNHFGKVFKEIVGVSPKAFRNNRSE